MPVSLLGETYKYEGIVGTDTNRIKSTKYGDNYEERRPDGINFNTQSWSVVFIYKSKGALDAFLLAVRSQGGVGTWVYWISPTDEVQQKYVIDNYSINILSPNYSEVSISLTRWYGN